MSDVKWIKLNVEMFNNRKVKHLRKLPEGNNLVLIWVMLLTIAGRCNADGRIYLTEKIPYTSKMLADELEFEESTVHLALQSLESFEMIFMDNGYITITGWEEHQSNDRLADIRERDRERKRLKRAQAKALNSTSSDVRGLSVDCPYIEEEGEKDKEKESHSFVLSREEAKQRYLGGTLGKGVVMLSEEQMDSLLEELSIEEFDKYVGIVADMELSGKHYKKKTHYQAILDMAAKDRRTKA
jgi:predicted phage replisome organizer